MPIDRDDVAERLAFVVGVLNRRLRPNPESLSHVGLSALASVDRAGAIRPGDLARVEGIAAPGATRLLAELEARGLVSREADPQDGRSTLVRMTSAGVAAVIDARRERADAVARLLDAVDEDDLAAVAQTVQVIESALERARTAIA